MVAVHENAEDPLATSADASGHVCPRVLGAQNPLARPLAVEMETASSAALSGERAAALCVRAQPNVVVSAPRALPPRPFDDRRSVTGRRSMAHLEVLDDLPLARPRHPGPLQ